MAEFRFTQQNFFSSVSRVWQCYNLKPDHVSSGQIDEGKKPLDISHTTVGPSDNQVFCWLCPGQGDDFVVRTAPFNLNSRNNPLHQPSPNRFAHASNQDKPIALPLSCNSSPLLRLLPSIHPSNQPTTHPSIPTFTPSVFCSVPGPGVWCFPLSRWPALIIYWWQ